MFASTSQRSPHAATPKSVPHQGCLIIDQLLSSSHGGKAANIFRNTASKVTSHPPHSAQGLNFFLSAANHAQALLPGPLPSTAASAMRPLAPHFASLDPDLTLSRAFPSLPSSRLQSPVPMEGEGWDATAARESLASLASLEMPGGVGNGLTDWSALLEGFDRGAGGLMMSDAAW